MECFGHLHDGASPVTSINTESSVSQRSNIPPRGCMQLWCPTAYSLFSLCSSRNRRWGLHQSPERLPSWIIFMDQELFPCFIPTCVPFVQQDLLCSLPSRTSCHWLPGPTVLKWEEGFWGLPAPNISQRDNYTTQRGLVKVVKECRKHFGIFFKVIRMWAKSLCAHLHWKHNLNPNLSLIWIVKLMDTKVPQESLFH